MTLRREGRGWGLHGAALAEGQTVDCAGSKLDGGGSSEFQESREAEGLSTAERRIGACERGLPKRARGGSSSSGSRGRLAPLPRSFAGASNRSTGRFRGQWAGRPKTKPAACRRRDACRREPEERLRREPDERHWRSAGAALLPLSLARNAVSAT